MASTDSLRRVAALFDELAELSVEEKRDALARLRESDPALEAAVQKLFEAEEQMPALESTRKAETPQGRLFGPYRALSLIGQGGMGAVYLAERADGQYTRRAAIKVVQGATVSAEMRIRFLAERQILASLQHPGIAAMLDGGVSDAGEPYLVMEYVDGLPVDAFADRNKLTIPQRIDLFLEICAAVDFAHRHLIIHRDLKPSNILVDPEGKPKLLDFGAAKLLAPNDGDKTKQFLTPRYASPEQLRGVAASVSMDIYALGVILYELVAGIWPFGDPADMAANLRRATGEIAANPPTEVVTGEAAASRSTTIGALKQTLKGDLSAVLGKALEPDPARRYGSVSEFIADVLRFRRNEPVQARPQTRVYRLRKWIARNPVQTAAVSLAILGVLTGILLREQQRSVAERRFDELRSLARFQIFDLQEQMAYHGAAMPLRKAMAERSLAALDQLSEESAAPSFELQADLTEGYIQIAELLGNPMRSNLGEFDKGRKLLARAKQMNEILQAMQGSVRVKRVLQARYDIQEAQFDTQAGSAGERVKRAMQSMRDLEANIDANALDANGLLRLSMQHYVLHVSERQIGGAIDAYVAESSSLQRARRYLDLGLAKAPGNPLLRLHAVRVSAEEAEVMSGRDASAGIAKMREVLDVMRGLEPTMGVRFVRARLLGEIGWHEGQSQLYEDSIEHQSAAVEEWRGLVTASPAQLNLRYELSSALRSLAFANEYAGRRAEAVVAFEEGIRESEHLLSISPYPGVPRQLAEMRVRMGKSLAILGKTEEARASIRAGQTSILALANEPNAGKFLLTLAVRYLVDVPFADCRRPAEALTLANRLAASEQQDLFVLEALALAQAANGLRPETEQTLAKLKALIPKGNEAGLANNQKFEAGVREMLTALGK